MSLCSVHNIIIPSKCSGCYTYHEVYLAEILRSANTVYVPQNKRRLFRYTKLTEFLLGAFENLQKATVTFILSVCLSTRRTTRLLPVSFS